MTERESRPAGNQAAKFSAENDTDSNPLRAYNTGSAPGSTVCWVDRRSQLKRRQSAAHRLPPLDCGCPDPWPCTCTQPPLSEQMIDAGRDTALHFLRLDQVPILGIEVLQALYRRGGLDRELAEHLHAATGGALA
jgi:hypothetical protein